MGRTLLALALIASFPEANRRFASAHAVSEPVSASQGESAGAQAALSWPRVVNALEGAWDGRGTLFGNPAAFTMEWTKELDGRFVRLRFTNAFVTESGTSPIISAEAFYRLASATTMDGYWFDTRGLILTLGATTDDDRIVTDWAAPGIEKGRTTYRLLDTDTIEVVDEVQAEQGWREFARATYKRRQ